MIRLLVALLVLLLPPLPAAAEASTCRLPERLESRACAQQGPSRGVPGQFDFYVLALSWSPAFCADPRQARGNRLQCADNRFGFVVHGLWPQYQYARSGDKQPWPQYCQPDAAAVPEALLRRHLCRQPSAALMNCQWAKHGACSGLGMAAYFTAQEQVMQRLTLPDLAPGPNTAGAILEAFQKANAALGLKREHLVLIVEDDALSEIRICYAKNLTEFVACGSGMRGSRPERKLILH